MLSLDYRDARPIYEQVRDGLRRLVVTGGSGPGGEAPLRARYGQHPGHQPQHHSAGL